MSTHGLIFLGSKDAGLKALKQLAECVPKGTIRAVFCPDDRRDSRSVLTDFEAYANSQGFPINVVHGNDDLVTLVRKYAPSVCVVHGWYRVIPVAEFPSTEFVGFHYSPLPRYRGNAPLVWQIINGESRLGVSFFVMTPGMDEGDLLDQRFFDLSLDETIADALEKANCLVKDMLRDFSLRWSSDSLVRTKQSNETPTYCGMRIPEDGRIDWKQSAIAIHNFIRAQCKPYPGAFSILPDGGKIHIWTAAIDPRVFFGRPGSVVEVSDTRVVVACGSGALEIFVVQAEGGQETNPREILGSLKMRLV